MLEPERSRLAPVALPRNWTAVTHTSAIRASKRAYSTRLAPRSIRRTDQEDQNAASRRTATSFCRPGTPEGRVVATRPSVRSCQRIS